MTARVVVAIRPQGDWRERAACRTENPELFFPVSRGFRAQIDQAKAVCAACPVIAECNQWAVDNHQTAGIWGGRTEWERRAPRRAVA